MPARPLNSLRFDNTYAQLPETCYQLVFPTPLRDPKLAAFSPEAARLIDLDPAAASDPAFVRMLSGLEPLPGAWPLAQVYAGHQFGNFVPKLGDGRAILLGEAVSETPHIWNRRREFGGRKWDLHLKGAGPTAYSRQFDGRAVLRSCLREFLVSEAMEALGIPTSRALAVISSSEPVFRETPEPGSMLLRLAPCHIRIGTFEYFYFQKMYPELQELADFTLHQYFPEQAQAEFPYAAMLKEIILRTADLIACWQAYGFVHGVMNTDNCSVLGLTLDYGPFGFMETFEPHKVFNHSDPSGVYAFSRQPEVGFFNLQCLTRALSPLLTREQAEAALSDYEPALARSYLGLMADKLGLFQRREEDESLVSDLLEALQGHDYTLFMRRLADPATMDAPSMPLKSWMDRYQARLKHEAASPLDRKRHMDACNPAVILRTHLAQAAIDAATAGNYGEIEKLRQRLTCPFDSRDTDGITMGPQPPGSEEVALSCSS
ncbi:MAG: YdiU family protein [Verrucomicrobia bacterium]|nr:YdiU family protein [Verrucomicrobiota bacterium]